MTRLAQTIRTGGGRSANDAPARDLAPCRVGSAGALYDRVSGDVLYSATSTPLIPGPDLP